MSASSVTAWTDQARLSGAVRTAPEVVGRRRHGEGDDLLARQQLPAAGSRRRGDDDAHEEEQPRRRRQQDERRAPGHGGRAAPVVTAATARPGSSAAPTTARRRAGPRSAASRSATRAATWPTGPGGRARRHAVPDRVRGDPAPPLTPASRGSAAHPRRRSARRPGRCPATWPPRRTTASSHACAARATRWVETRTAAPAARSASHEGEGRVDAERVDAVEGLVEQQHAGANGTPPARPRAAGPCRARSRPSRGRPRRRGRTARAGPARARSQPVSPRSRAASCRCSQGVERGTSPPTSGQ